MVSGVQTRSVRVRIDCFQFGSTLSELVAVGVGGRDDGVYVSHCSWTTHQPLRLSQIVIALNPKAEICYKKFRWLVYTLAELFRKLQNTTEVRLIASILG